MTTKGGEWEPEIYFEIFSRCSEFTTKSKNTVNAPESKILRREYLKRFFRMVESQRKKETQIRTQTHQQQRAGNSSSLDRKKSGSQPAPKITRKRMRLARRASNN